MCSATANCKLGEFGNTILYPVSVKAERASVSVPPSAGGAGEFWG